jgi:hypothetical protein
MALLTPEQVRIERLRSAGRVFQKTDRVLSQADIEVEVANGGQNMAPAWNDGMKITFNAEMIGNINGTKDLIALSGLNYHELSHVLYTPRVRTPLRQEVRKGDLHIAFNMLEDQRIESLFAALYPASEPYFISVFTRFCLANEGAWTRNLLLAHGRRYLPQQMRDTFAAKFERQDLVAEVQDIIDSYRVLVPTADTDKSLKLIERFDAVLKEVAPPPDPFGHGVAVNGGGVIAGSRTDADTKGKPLSDKTQKQDAEWLDEDDDDTEEGDDSSGHKSDDVDTDDGEEGGAGPGDSADSDDDADAEDDGNGRGSDGDDTDEVHHGKATQDDDAPTPGASGGTDGGALTDAEARAAMEAIAEAADTSEAVVQDIAQKQRVIRNSTGSKHIAALPSMRFGMEQADPVSVNIARKFAKNLSQLQSDLDPAWNRHQPSGKLNIGRVIAGADVDSMWDSWDEGKQDALDTEVCLFMDISSSMSHELMYLASLSTWIIKRAFDTLNVRCTVYAFNEEGYMMYGAEEKVGATEFRLFRSSGGTNPAQAMRDALSTFYTSRRRHKIAMLVTDGGFDGDGYYGQYTDPMNQHFTNDGLIQTLNANGVITAMAFLDPYGRGARRNVGEDLSTVFHNVKVGAYVNQPADLIPLARSLAARAARG